MSIKLKSLAATKLADTSLEKGYLYKDIAFDLTPSVALNAQLNRHEPLRDVQALYDLEAVKNSIKNCFLTSPGQKILNPTFGIDLRRHLFDPIDDFTSEIIRDDILRKLPIMEPRVTIKFVEVEADEDQNQYNIFLQIDVPSLDAYGISIKSLLNVDGYVII